MFFLQKYWFRIGLGDKRYHIEIVIEFLCITMLSLVTFWLDMDECKSRNKGKSSSQCMPLIIWVFCTWMSAIVSSIHTLKHTTLVSIWDMNTWTSSPELLWADLLTYHQTHWNSQTTNIRVQFNLKLTEIYHYCILNCISLSKNIIFKAIQPRCFHLFFKLYSSIVQHLIWPKINK